MKFLKENLNLILCLIIMCMITCVMFYFIDKKEGFHEDEIFSYGASNSKLSNTFLSYRQVDDLDTIIKRKGFFETFKNRIYYFIDKEAYRAEKERLGLNDKTSIWRTREDANEYMKIDSGEEAMDFFTVYWNTARDVHPPLFYFLVHIVSIIFYNKFSKYIIFLINLIFFLGICILIRKIFQKLNKNYLSISSLILYGFSVGAISTVMFQRMYTMLTFFTVWFLYTNIKIYYNDFKLDRKLKLELCIVTILGFLTQYYFCFYVVGVTFTMLMILLKRKEYKKSKEYFSWIVISAILGMILFFPCIYHIFFSYRGLRAEECRFTFIEKLLAFMKNSYWSFGLPVIVGVIFTIILAGIFIWKFRKSGLMAILIVPLIIYFICVVKMSPFRSLRYIMNILPIICLVTIIIFDGIMSNKKFSAILITLTSIVISLYGILNYNVKYLYKGYNDYLKIAEENKDKRYVLICENEFSHIQDVPEMMIYKETKIVPPNKLKYLKNDEKLEGDSEFILSIKNWVNNPEDILHKVLENTGYTHFELLLNTDKEVAKCRIYKISK